jgi:hypothetical protein
MTTATKPANKKGIQQQQQQREATNRPVHEVRLGRIRAAVWANSTETGIRHNVTISRLYKDEKSGEWRDSSSFGRDDLPLIGKVVDMAHTWIYENGSSNGGEGK